MPRVRMTRSPMGPADYADHLGLWSVGTVYEMSPEDWERKQQDHPGCFVLDEPEAPIRRPPRAVVVAEPPQDVAVKAPPRARRRKR